MTTRRPEEGASPARRGDLVHLDPDRALLARVAAGDHAAAADLVRGHQAVMVRFVSRMLGAEDPAVDDVVQQSFVAALAAAARHDGRASVRSWLLGIAHNKVKMRLRARTRRRRAHEGWWRVATLGSRVEAPDSDRREVGDRIAAALDTLDADRRAVFLLVEAEGHTAREAAAIVGAPEGTVRRWRVEAREALQPLLADLWPATPADEEGSP